MDIIPVDVREFGRSTTFAQNIHIRSDSGLSQFLCRMTEQVRECHCPSSGLSWCCIFCENLKLRHNFITYFSSRIRTVLLNQLDQIFNDYFSPVFPSVRKCFLFFESWCVCVCECEWLPQNEKPQQGAWNFRFCLRISSGLDHYLVVKISQYWVHQITVCDIYHIFLEINSKDPPQT